MKKFKRAVTDSETGPDACATTARPSPACRNLLEINAAVTGRTPHEVRRVLRAVRPLKVDTGEAVLAVLDPIRARYDELMDDRGELARLLRVGADRARGVAAGTLDRVHRAIGMLPA